jgi:hypothetical protein
MTRKTRVAVLLAGAAALGAVGVLTSRLAGGEARTEVSAILVHGSLVSAPVLIDRAKVASALHDEVQRVQRYVPRYPKELLTRRPCLTMSAFLPGGRTDRKAADRLRPDRADATWSYYPAVDHEPAVLGNARMSDGHVALLARHGLPTRVARGGAAACRPQSGVAVIDTTD